MAALVALARCWCTLSRFQCLAVGNKSAVSLFVRGKKNWQSEVDRQLYLRRLEDGPEPVRRRAAMPNWDYSKELYAFNARFKENVDEDTLRTAFDNRVSTVDTDDKGSTAVSVNSNLVQSGKEYCSKCLQLLTQKSYPNLPSHGIESVVSHLLSQEVLIRVAGSLGLKDLIVSEDVLPTEPCMVNTLFAVVGAILLDTGEKRAGLFVRDFIFTQLVDQDICNLIQMSSPMGVLSRALADMGRGEAEARLIGEAGSNTVEAVFEVGIYSDKQLIGQSPGETPLIAEEMAARNALMNLYGTRLHDTDINYAKLDPTS